MNNDKIIIKHKALIIEKNFINIIARNSFNLFRREALILEKILSISREERIKLIQVSLYLIESLILHQETFLRLEKRWLLHLNMISGFPYFFSERYISLKSNHDKILYNRLCFCNRNSGFLGKVKFLWLEYLIKGLRAILRWCRHTSRTSLNSKKFFIVNLVITLWLSWSFWQECN